uniref:Uncharacterized protein n=1 Tax=Pseudomonas putida TaxID=303 RepID=A0A6C0L775_PSEPU|nr:hypothetical protein [Pseudomonas putida]
MNGGSSLTRYQGAKVESAKKVFQLHTVDRCTGRQGGGKN